MNANALQREALRQQMLLRALLGDARPGVVQGWLAGAPQRQLRGLQVYQANAGALAERALGAALPTLAQLLGDESFAALARAFWRRHPPTDGDIANWGAELPAFIEADAQLAPEPYLADVARLEWALHQAERAADDDAAPTGLDRLAEADPAQLRLRLRAGTWAWVSPHPVHAIWAAHRSDAPDRFEPVRAALQAGQGEAVRVRRQGWRAVVQVVAEPVARFEQATLQGASLAQALQAAGAGFDFETWFLQALRDAALAAVEPLTDTHP